jgi:hypothetical protein
LESNAKGHVAGVSISRPAVNPYLHLLAGLFVEKRKTEIR